MAGNFKIEQNSSPNSEENGDMPLNAEDGKLDLQLMVESMKQEDDIMIKARDFNHMKSKYQDCKLNLINAQTRYFFLESLKNGAQIPADKAQDVKEASKAVRRKKEEILELKLQRESDAETIDTLMSEHDELQKKIEEAKLEGKTIRKRIERSSEHESERLASLRGELATLQGVLGEQQSKVERVRQMHEQLTQREEELSRQQAEQAGTGDVQQQAWYTSVYAVLSRLSGVRVKSTSDRECVLVMGDSGGAHKELEITVKFDTDPLLGSKISHVQLSDPSLDVGAVVAGVLGGTDLLGLMTGVHQCWQQHRPLAEEVDALRQRFALDWVPSSGTVTVIYGANASNVVTLAIDKGYPGSGQVTLVSVTGELAAGVTEDHIKPTNPSASLTEWLECLHSKLHT